jgi:predicted RNA-binding protein (virulence factor B family)
MKSAKLFGLAVALLFGVGGVVMASQASGTSGAKQTTATTTKASVTTHHEMGTVESMTSNELVLDHAWKGKAEKTKFTIDSTTKKDENVKTGDRITVYYHVEKNGDRIATEIKPETKTGKS